MPMSLKSFDLLRHIVENLVNEQFASGTITQVQLNASPFVKGKIGPEGMVGIRKEAAESLFNYADAIFSASRLYQRGTTFKGLYNELSDVIINNFFGRKPDELKASDVVFVESKIDEWFQKMIATHELYIPCILSRWFAPPFTIGPVKFTHIDDFVVQERTRNKNYFDITFNQVLNAMRHESAHWMATIAIDSCTQDRAWEIGELAVDIGLVGIQLAVPLENSKHMARMTARTIPRFRHTVSRSNGSISGG